MQLRSLILFIVVVFIFLNIFFIFSEYLFPYSYIKNYKFSNIYYLGNYYLVSSSSFLISLAFVFIISKNINIKLNLKLNENLAKFFFLIIIGSITFVISKLFLLVGADQINLINDYCSVFRLKEIWIESGSVEQEQFYKIMSPIGMLLINAYIVPLFVSLYKNDINWKYTLLIYLFIFIPVSLQYLLLQKKIVIINLLIFTIIFSFFNFIKSRKIKILNVIIVLIFSIMTISYSFYLRGYCVDKKTGNKLDNYEFTKEEKTLSNFNHPVYIKKESKINFVNHIRHYLRENPGSNYFVYYITHAKQNSDLYSTIINHNRSFDNWYIKNILNYVSRNILFNNFSYGEALYEKYKIKKIRGGTNLHFVLWLDYGVFGMFFFNLIFFILLFLNIIISKYLSLKSNFTSSINILLITVYLHQIFFSNLFIGISVFNSIFLFFLLSIFLIINSYKKK